MLREQSWGIGDSHWTVRRVTLHRAGPKGYEVMTSARVRWTWVACIGCALFGCAEQHGKGSSVDLDCATGEPGSCEDDAGFRDHDVGYDGGYTAAATWGAAASLGNDAMGFARAAFATNDAGHAHMVWLQGDRNGNHQGVWANRYLPDEGWDTPTSVAVPDTEFFGIVRVGVDAAGNALAVWDAEMSVWACRYELGSGWDAPIAIAPAASGADLGDVALGVDGAGNGIASWTRGNQGIWSARYTPGGGWDTAARIADTAAENAHHVDLAVDGIGNATVVWAQADSAARATAAAHTSIWAVRYLADSGWGNPMLIGDAAEGAYSVELATANGGDSVVVWNRSEPTGVGVWANRFVDSSWDVATSIESHPEPHVESAQVAVNDDGDALVAWVAPDADQHVISVKRYRPSSGWQAAELIDVSQAGALAVQVAMNEDGNALLAWARFDGTVVANLNHHEIWAAHYLEGMGWQTPARIQTQDADWAATVGLGFNGSGRAHAAWLQWSGTSYSLWARRFE